MLTGDRVAAEKRSPERPRIEAAATAAQRGLARSGPGAARASLMSIFAQDLDPGLPPESVASRFWTVSPCAYRGTRIAGHNVTLPGHWCHLVRMGEDLHDRLGAALAFRTIGRIFENNRKSEPLHIHKTPVASSGRPVRKNRRGRSKPHNQRWIELFAEHNRPNSDVGVRCKSASTVDAVLTHPPTKSARRRW